MLLPQLWGGTLSGLGEADATQYPEDVHRMAAAALRKLGAEVFAEVFAEILEQV